MTVAAPEILGGCGTLVAEDRYLMARKVTGALAEVGAETLGPAATVARALAVAAAEAGHIDAALLDSLLARGVPVVLATGYDATAIPDAYAHLPRREKPATGRDLARVLTRALAPQSPAEG